MDDAALFADRLREALRASGRTLEQCVDFLAQQGTPVSSATLSYWSSGRSVPRRAKSLTAVTHLEHYLGLEPGWLVGTLPQVSPQGWAPAAVLPRHPGLGAAFEQLGLGLDREVNVVMRRDRLVLREDESDRHISLVMRAEAARVDTLPVAHELPVGGADWSIAPHADVATTEILEVPTTEAGAPKLLVFGLQLPTRLRRGEALSISYRFRFRHRPGFRGQERVELPSAGGAHLQVQEVSFEHAQPRWVRHEHLPAHGQQALPGGELVPARHVQVVRRQVPVGRFAISWGW
ncbi:hypothetical protein [Luteococcus sp. OSA5]|uniref:hypothetical protein n=1 Tax=Luteococcus sp. OSA5 TaxID=3401630 RepID=UPI003B4287D4